MAFWQPLISDEFETLASAKMMSDGSLIYKDFFQHHGPLSYLLYLPVFKYIKSIFLALLLSKLVAICVLILILLLVFKISEAITKSKFMGLLGVLMVIADPLWAQYGAQVRPDAIMTVFALGSLYLLLIYDEGKRNMFLCWAGACFGLAFFAKQSAIVSIFIFALIYLRGNFRRYLHYFLGFFIVALPVFVYFFAAKAVNNFLRYFILFNLRAHPTAEFNISERLWLFFSPLIPAGLRISYGLITFIFIYAAIRVYFAKGKSATRFINSLLLSSLIGMFLTFLYKTPYPQYYLAIHLMFIIVIIFHLNEAPKKLKKAMMFFLAGVSIVFAFVKFEAMIRKNDFLAQSRCLSSISDLLRSKKAIGPSYMVLAGNRAGFYWYYPPIFSDVDLKPMFRALKDADIVFYDHSLSLLAPLDFKKKLFTDFEFIGRYSLPFNNNLNFDYVSVFSKDRDLAEKMISQDRLACWNYEDGERGLLKDPLYIPVYFKARLSGNGDLINLRPGKNSFSYKVKQELYLSMFISANKMFFDRSTNILYNLKPNIKYSIKKAGIAFECRYREPLSTDGLLGLGLRTPGENGVNVNGVISIKFSRYPDKIKIQEVPDGYKVMSAFNTDSLTIDIHCSESLLGQASD
jgi:hypothetical protein